LFLVLQSITDMPVHGEERKDGKVFWGLHKASKNGEEWTSKESFIRRKAKSRAKQWMNRRRRAYWLNKYKEYQGCDHCGYDENGVAMQFHHLNDHTKAGNVSDLRSSNLKTLFAEIRKCHILCANCHAIETTRLQQAN